MNKLLKPFALLFAVAITSGSFAQEGDAGKQEIKNATVKSYNQSNIVDPHKAAAPVNAAPVKARPGKLSKAVIRKNTQATIQKQGVTQVSVVR